jgi:hypothetical protein
MRMALLALVITSFFSLNLAVASDWSNRSAVNQDVEGATVYYAYTVGKQGHLFAVVCDDRGLSVDLEMRGTRAEGELVELSWKIDRWSKMPMTGEAFPKEVSGYFLTFFDAASLPLPENKELIRRARLGSKLRVSYKQENKLLDKFSLRGSEQAITQVKEACDGGLGNAPKEG